MAFSGALTLTDLNDYLGPSQACIKPVEASASDSKDANGDAPDSDSAGGASTQIAIDREGAYYELDGRPSAAATQQHDDGTTTKPRQRTKLETAEISLDDCLACSGCVTSAESVLITMQSQEEMRRAIDEIHASQHPKLLVASISPQTLASLSARYSFSDQQPASGPSSSAAASQSIPLRTLLHRITHFLKGFGFDYVLDTTFARHLSLKEHEREFFERRSNSLKRKRDPAAALGASARRSGDEADDEPTLPMLASACPGWICYAEKTHGELLPFVSKTKSPQQISGVLAKKFIASRLGITPETAADEDQAASSKLSGVYHVTVMPCYDKKLEASRPDFFEEITGTKEVDCVLTTGELDKLMTDEGFDVSKPVDGEAAEPDLAATADLTLAEALGGATASCGANGADKDRVTVLPQMPTLLDHPGSSSGGYLFNLMRAVWLDWLGEAWDRLPSDVKSSAVLPQLDVKIIRTSDFTEYVLRAPALPSTAAEADLGSESTLRQQLQRPILFRAAQCYGFRNLQNLVRKLQRQTGVKSGKGAAGRLVDADGKAVGNGAGGRGRMTRGRGRGMVRRGRGGAAADSRGAVDSDVVSGASTPAAADGDEEEAYGYDYVEVMACPGGCVNGGGQLRPPVGSEAPAPDVGATEDVDDAGSMINKGCSKRGEAADGTGAQVSLDPEGYTSGWASAQTASVDAEQDVKMHGLGGDGKGEEKEIKGWQGTSKEWVKRVERAYWSASQFSHTPVGAVLGSTSASGTSTPLRSGVSTRGASTPLGAATSKREARGEDKARLLDALVSQQAAIASPAKDGAESDGVVRVQPDSLIYADLLADLVTKELSALAAGPAFLGGQQKGELADALVEARKRLFRTQYRAVKDEMVSGLAVQW
ncbi:uncharacterized protein PFL1_03904 [Pseudozyma flocculosa PF-1]|uniref:Related to Cytosolic Fe-S cluster assembly factor NAR1 n=2 Tax=Pseudozyma flocculosa TaxID=84751 RepID=A0A5C3EWU9_9BASI|nr:uncharacterized protein PFL1_03904 [Pseudozyma flocculosa PF-1]EPQ28601.1 hypothetical protein PFL1_03904 [Pseudozyma flocculosa PF-1]SPO36542.1 related to Cytosolic Fe-S cluster assembly factor NAR1 [Pseudozyma flocculosa]